MGFISVSMRRAAGDRVGLGRAGRFLDSVQLGEQLADAHVEPACSAWRRMRRATVTASTHWKTWVRILDSVQWCIGEPDTTLGSGVPRCVWPRRAGRVGDQRPPPPQPGRRPPSQRCALPGRHRWHSLTPAHHRLRRTAHRRGQVEEVHHPLFQALPRPRVLPAPRAPGSSGQVARRSGARERSGRPDPGGTVGSAGARRGRYCVERHYREPSWRGGAPAGSRARWWTRGGPAPG